MMFFKIHGLEAVFSGLKLRFRHFNLATHHFLDMKTSLSLRS